MYPIEVPFKSNGESARFFEDHVEFKGQSVIYDDVATLTVHSAITIHTYIGIPMGRSFDGMVSFKMNNGKKHLINMNAMAVFGIPIIRNPRENEKLFPLLFDAVNSIVAKNMALKRINEIKGGATVEVAGLSINNTGATPVKDKKGIIISRENYRDSILTNGYGVAIYDKTGVTLWSSSVWSYDNNLLIPYILDTVFG